jgi:HK97 family phage portal protein
LGLLDLVKGRNNEVEYMYDFELIGETSKRIHMKKLAIETCVGLIGRTICQSEFYVKENNRKIKDEMYYRLNVKPNLNMSASHFWQTIVHKLIHDNECLVIQSDTGDLLIADSFTRVEYPLVGDTFRNVMVKNYSFSRTFQMADVIYLEYSNEELSKLIDSLYTDYGELFGRIVEYQKRKGQIRGLVDIESTGDKGEKAQEKLQNYINKIFKAFTEKAVAIIPQQKGFKYDEKSNGQSQSVDEVNKVADAFLDQVAKSLGIPVAILHGNMADVEKPTRNLMTFCIDPLLKKIKDELNAKVIVKKDYLAGKRVEVRRVTYRNMFDVATAVDKLRSSGTLNGNELREELGLEWSDDPMMEKYFMTKNYEESNKALKGGEKDEA